MDRRTYLGWAGIGAATALGGCISSPRGGGKTRSAAANGPGVDSVAGVELPVPRSELSRGAAKDAIPAITEPVFADDWGGYDAQDVRLSPDDRVIGVTRDGRARAYPLRVLVWHEVVNDTFAGPLLVTYCPLCGSAVTAKRTVDGKPTVFGVSGLLWNSDLVMYDEATGSLWSQIAATAIRGPETGERLSLVPSRLTTWKTWQADYPSTKVLVPPPASNTVVGRTQRNYGSNPYAAYDDSDGIGIGENETQTGGPDLHPKTTVLGITADGAAKAYPLPAVRKAGVVNDVVGDLPVVVAVAADGSTLVGYERRVEGDPLTFERVGASFLRAGGSRWRITTGTAVDGPHEGTTLADAATRSPMFWFAWHDFHPETDVYRRDE